MSNQHAENRTNNLQKLIQSIIKTKLSQRKLEKILTWAEKQSKIDHISINKDTVFNHLDGLSEKFDIVGRTDLSIELEKRVKKVKQLADNKRNYSVLQCLYLIRELSVDPWHHKVVIASSKDNSDDRTVQLTWDDILKEEPLEGTHWNELSDEEDGLLSEQSDEGNDSQIEPISPDKIQHRLPVPSITIRDEPKILPQSFINTDPYDINSSAASIKNMKSSYWLTSSDHSHSYILSNSDVLREVFLSLLGVPNTLFIRETIEKFNYVTVRDNISFNVPHLTAPAALSVLEEFAGFASVMAQLRQFSLIYFVMAEFPKFNYRYILGILVELLQNLEIKILKIQDELQNDKNATISISRTLILCRNILEPYAVVISVMKAVCIQSATENTLVALLNVLYDRVCTCGMSADESYPVLVDIFCRVIQDCIRIMRPWLSKGTISDEQGFCVVSNRREDESTDKSTEWSQLQISTDNSIECLVGYNGSILSAGKAAFLLNKLLDSTDPILKSIAPPLDIPTLFTSLIGENGTGNFANILHLQLHEYFTTVEQNNNRLLHNYLVSECLLKETLENHFNVFFMFDSLSSSSFLEKLFERVDTQLPINRHSVADTLEETWRYTVTSSLFNIISVVPGNSLDFQIKIDIPLSNIAFGTILTSDNLKIYQSIWTLLLHCRRIHHHAVRVNSLVSFLFINFLNIYLLYLHESVLRRETKALLDKLDRVIFQHVIDSHDSHLLSIYKRSLLGTTAGEDLMGLLKYGYDIYYDNNTDDPALFYKVYNKFCHSLEVIDDPVVQPLSQLLNCSVMRKTH